MEKLLIYRERFLKFLTARGRYIQSGMRFLGGTVLFYVLGELFGYTETFSQPFFIFMMGSDQCLYSNISIIADLLCRYILRVTSCIVRSDIIFCTGSCIIFSCISESFSRDKDLSDDGANLLLFSTACMFTNLCWDVLWNCRTSSDLNGNSDLLSVQYPSADNEPAGIRISTWEGLQSDRGKSDRQ